MIVDNYGIYTDKIELGDGISSITNKSFANRLSGIRSITIPSYISGFGNNTFYGCSNLK